MNPCDRLAPLGWGAFFEAGLAEAGPEAGAPARVCAAHREMYDLWTADGGPESPLRAHPPGRWRVSARSPLDLPTVGDWVTFTRPVPGGEARITGVLPRRSLFVRRAAGERAEAQAVAANVDVVFLVSGLDGDLNARRLRRYLAQLHGSGAEPVLLLNKADRLGGPEARTAVLAELEELAASWPVHVLSALEDTGLEALEPYLRPGRTVALVGSSGVGKSTVANRLLARPVQRTREVRAHDARGQHTTSSRVLFVLPNGALLLDTPGMRSLGLWESDEGVDAVFSDVTTLASACRFRDCRHRGEPGCAVTSAVAAGELTGERLEEWDALRREAAWEARKHDPRAAAEARRRWRLISKASRRLRD